MSGDLGNLLTGELGEAEARFSHEDFAALYGRRIAGRVRRRRAVRAAGVSGGTMLTAGALVVGVTQVPWGTLGATTGVGASDCVTTAPSSNSFAYTVTEAPSGTRLRIDYTYPTEGSVVLRDSGSGEAVVAGATQPDGTVAFVDADGNPLAAVLNNAGEYVVTLGSGATLSISAPNSAQYQSTRRGVVVMMDGQWVVESMTTVESGESPMSTPSDDCVTSGPTPSGDATASPDPIASADPSLAAKPEDVIGDSPFECGFPMDSLVHDSSQVSITGYEWVDPADFNATLHERWPTSTSLALERGTSPMPVAKVRVTQDQSVLAGGFGPGEPTDETAGTADGSPMVNTGASFVGVQDGVVVATADTATEGTEGENSHFFLDYDGTTHSLTLVNASDAFIACPGQTFDPATGTIFAVAGSYVLDKSGVYSTDVEYSWAALERN